MDGERVARLAPVLALFAAAGIILVALASLRVGGVHTAAALPQAAAATAGLLSAGAAGSGSAAVAATPSPLVCIDPGHSLANPSIVVSVPLTDEQGRSRDVELREVDVNLDVAREVARLLRRRFGGAAVVMTWGEVDNLPRHWNALQGPAGDEKPDVMARGAFCADQGAAAIVSIHTNSFGEAPDGTLIGYRDQNGRALAVALHDAILDGMAVDPSGAPVPDFADYGLDQGDWFIALGVGDRDVPVVILEPVMMSNVDEARRLVPAIAEAPDGRRAQIARVEADALTAWIESSSLAAR